MISSIIIDDEPRSIDVLQSLVKTYCPQVEVKATTKDAEEGIALIKSISPDIVFLDIEMPYINGFSLLESIVPIKFETIFVTAFENYAIKAFKYNALDYLLKPVSIEELKSAVEKAVERVENKNKFLYNKADLQKICLPVQDGIIFANINDIIRCKADGKYTWFHFSNNEKMLVCKNLKEYEQLLPDNIFFRAHHSHLINLNYIHKYYRGKNNIIEMKDGSMVELSNRKKDIFLSKF
jgi:two-component system LytT family response regulator